jgi:hypothetical protein
VSSIFQCWNQLVFKIVIFWDLKAYLFWN